MEVAAIIVAGGRGSRAGNGKPKQYRTIGGEPVLRRTLRAFDAHPAIETIITVIHPDDAEDYAAAAEGIGKCGEPALGGSTRQRSVFSGLRSITLAKPSFVLVHDAARPFVPAALIDRALDAVKASGAAIPVLPVTDTVKRVDASGLDRKSVV